MKKKSNAKTKLRAGWLVSDIPILGASVELAGGSVVSAGVGSEIDFFFEKKPMVSGCYVWRRRGFSKFVGWLFNCGFLDEFKWKEQAGDKEQIWQEQVG
jgi:hypothetical protein